jgi:hypothetical protein
MQDLEKISLRCPKEELIPALRNNFNMTETSVCAKDSGKKSKAALFFFKPAAHSSNINGV